MKVEIVRVEARDGDAGMVLTRRVEVLVDGAKIGEGWFGGEPEDNYEFRDYGWVIPMLGDLAARLGAEVSETTRGDEVRP